MTPIICAKPSPPRARSPLFPTTRHGRSNIRSTNISMPSAISWSAASKSSSSSGASQRASRKLLGTIRPWSPLPPSSYGCDKCPQDLAHERVQREAAHGTCHVALRCRDQHWRIDGVWFTKIVYVPTASENQGFDQHGYPRTSW